MALRFLIRGDGGGGGEAVDEKQFIPRVPSSRPGRGTGDLSASEGGCKSPVGVAKEANLMTAVVAAGERGSE